MSARRAGVLLTLAVFLVLSAAPPSEAGGREGELWVSHFNGPGHGYDLAKAVVSSQDGATVFVTGWTNGPTSGYDYLTAAYEASTGTLRWAAPYNGVGNGTDYGNEVAASPDGARVFMTGSSTGTNSGFDYATRAYDASTGSVLWSRRYNGTANLDDEANGITVSPDGSKVFVTGGSIGTNTASDFVTIAYDTSTGATLWTRRNNGLGDFDDVAKSVTTSPDGSRVFATGYTLAAGGTSDYVTAAYDSSTGAVLWIKTYNGPGNYGDGASAVAVTPDGSKVLVTGVSWGATQNEDYATVAYGASGGSQLWVRRYNGPGDGPDYATSLGISPDGSKAFVTGVSAGASDDFATVAYEISTGAMLWLTRYDGPITSTDYASSITVTPDGAKAVVTGWSTGIFGDYDIATVAYDASAGTESWVRRYDGPAGGVDAAYSIAASPTGSEVFVVGESRGLTRGWFTALAYPV